MKLYCDASVFTAIVLGDVTAPAAAGCLDTPDAERLYSDLGWGELIAALGRQVRIGHLHATVASSEVDRARTLLRDWTDVATISADITQAAIWLSDFTLALKLPDTIHIAIVHRLGATLVSTDRQQVVAARTLGIQTINPLEENR